MLIVHETGALGNMTVQERAALHLGLVEAKLGRSVNDGPGQRG